MFKSFKSLGRLIKLQAISFAPSALILLPLLKKNIDKNIYI